MKFNIKKGDIVTIESQKNNFIDCLVTKVSRKANYLEFMPVIDSEDYEGMPIRIPISFQLIKNIKNVSKFDMLYYLNNKNPYIKNAVEKKIRQSNIC